MNQFETFTKRVVGGYEAYLRTAADGQAKPLLSKGGIKTVFPTKLEAVEAINENLVNYVNGHLFRCGEIAGETVSVADQAFKQILRQKGKSRVIEVSHKGGRKCRKN